MPRDTRAEILAVATELFTDQGYEKTSLREIAERLDITQAALYYHFPSNRQPVELIGQRLDEMRDHIALHEQLAKAAHAAASDLRQEIRMVAALAALTAFDDWAPSLLAETPTEILREELSNTIHDILGLPRCSPGAAPDAATAT